MGRPTVIIATRRSLVVLFLLLALSCSRENDTTSESSTSSSQAEGPKNVVLVVVDSLRPSHLGRNGFRRKTAPFIEDLMDSSMVFRHAFTVATSSAPATASLLTSLYPPSHGVTESQESYSRRARTLETLGESLPPQTTLPTDVPTLAESFAKAGYQTVGVVANPDVTEERGFARGFEQFRLIVDGSAREVADQAKAWMEEQEEPEPTFLYLHFNDPQKPYAHRRPWYRESLDPEKQTRSAYISEIGFTDKALKGLYEDLGWAKDTLLILTSNHGEELWDHGEVGHGTSLYNELLRVLWVIHGPEVPRRTVEANVHLLDVAPTLLDLVGISFEPRDGLSHRHLFQQHPPKGVIHRLRLRTLFAHLEKHRTSPAGRSDHLVAAVRGPYKMISSPRGDELFQWINDPGEHENLLVEAPQHSEANDLRRALDVFREKFLDNQEETAPRESVSDKLERLLLESQSQE